MIPVTGTDMLAADFSPKEMPSRTWAVNFASGRVSGYADGLEAMRQAVYLILNTERYQYPIYSRNYGVELAGLAGRPVSYALPEIKRRVTEALTQDSRVTSVDGWGFDVGRGKVLAKFTAHTVFGDVAAEKEAAV